jgi:hypothetical protein
MYGGCRTIKPMSLSLLIPQEAVKKVLKRLAKLGKTAGVEVYEIPGTSTLVDGDRSIVCARIEIGPMPSVGGYEFAARIEHTPAGNVIVRGPGETKDLDASWRTAEPHCSHCSTKRARKETFLLRQYGVALLQIGRNCLADFLMTDPSRMVAAAELAKSVSGIMGDDGQDCWGGWGGHWEPSVLAFVAAAVASTERNGFVKSSEPGRTTRTDAEWLCNPPPKDSSDFKAWTDQQPTADQIENAHAVIAWASDAGPGASEYRWNLSLAVKQQGIGKHAGLLASAPIAFNRELGKRAEKKAAPARAEGYAVEEGFIFKGEATLIRHYLSESDWGSVAICTFLTDAGHEIVWFASGVAPKPDMQGMRFQIKGRCKKHASRNGVSQTILSRVTWAPVQQAESAA